MDYRDFSKEFIGESDFASLVMVGMTKNGLFAGFLKFGEDNSYSAYMADGDAVEIGSHYERVGAFHTWLKIYDDSALVKEIEAPYIDVYRAGEMGCIIHTYHTGDERRFHHERDKSNDNKKRLFVDMDGTLAEFKNVDTLETLYEQGYFLNLEPQMNVVEAVREIIQNHSDIEVYVMSSALSDSKYAVEEKNAWIDRYLPEIDPDHRIFPPCGDDKKDYIPALPGKNNYLLDDYTKNLKQWEPPCVGIKLMNGINGTHGTWTGERVEADKRPEAIADEIMKVIHKPDNIKKQQLLGQNR